MHPPPPSPQGHVMCFTLFHFRMTRAVNCQYIKSRYTIHVHVKVAVHCAFVLAALLYDAETWAIKQPAQVAGGWTG